MVQTFREQVNPEVIVSSLLNIFQKADLSKDGKWYVHAFFFQSTFFLCKLIFFKSNYKEYFKNCVSLQMLFVMLCLC